MLHNQPQIHRNLTQIVQKVFIVLISFGFCCFLCVFALVTNRTLCVFANNALDSAQSSYETASDAYKNATSSIYDMGMSYFEYAKGIYLVLVAHFSNLFKIYFRIFVTLLLVWFYIYQYFFEFMQIRQPAQQIIQRKLHKIHQKLERLTSILPKVIN